MTNAQRVIFNDPKLTAAEKNAALFKLTTAFRPGHSHNFTPIRPTPSKPVSTAGSRFATA